MTLRMKGGWRALERNMTEWRCNEELDDLVWWRSVLATWRRALSKWQQFLEQTSLYEWTVEFARGTGARVRLRRAICALYEEALKAQPQEHAAIACPRPPLLLSLSFRQWRRLRAADLQAQVSAIASRRIRTALLRWYLHWRARRRGRLQLAVSQAHHVSSDVLRRAAGWFDWWAREQAVATAISRTWRACCIRYLRLWYALADWRQSHRAVIRVGCRVVWILSVQPAFNELMQRAERFAETQALRLKVTRREKWS